MGVAPQYTLDDLANLCHVVLTSQSTWIKGANATTKDAGEDLL